MVPLHYCAREEVEKLIFVAKHDMLNKNGAFRYASRAARRMYRPLVELHTGYAPSTTLHLAQRGSIITWSCDVSSRTCGCAFARSAHDYVFYQKLNLCLSISTSNGQVTVLL